MNDYKYSTDWFSLNIPVWDALLQDFKGKPALKVLEIGSWEGRSAVWFLENVLTDEESYIDCVDIFTDLEAFNNFQHNLSFFNGKCRLYQGSSAVLLKKEPFLSSKGSYDIIYVDGDHKAPAVYEDAVECFGLLKSGGVMIFDDYAGGDSVAPGVDLFLKNNKDKLEVIHKKYQVAIRKS